MPVKMNQTLMPKPLHPRETVVFYRGYGHYGTAGRCWHLEIHGRIFAPSRKHIRKRALLHVLKRVVKPVNDLETYQRFIERAHLFLVDSRRNKSIPISIGTQAFRLPNSLSNGHFQTTLTIPEADLDSVTTQDELGRRMVRFGVHLPETDGRDFAGEIELISPQGISLVSDVDDTIKVTNVGDRRELLANTFTREFRAVEGMAGLYRNWARQGTRFHYVSSSPWPLYVPLTDWLRTDGFPSGSVHLRHMRLSELRANRHLSAGVSTKQAKIERLLRDFPQRQFVLCGDSTERDPEMYGRIRRSFGPQIVYILIRRVGDVDRNAILERVHNAGGEGQTLVFDSIDDLESNEELAATLARLRQAAEQASP